jgi:hypothetical protein
MGRQTFTTMAPQIIQDNIVSMVNFAENYCFEIQNEVQNMHWYFYQHIWYTSSHHNLDFDPNETTLFNEYHFYISNDCKYDYEFV